MFPYLPKFKAINLVEQIIQVEGGFYGKDADEVAGTYQGNDKFGVFGARKN